MSGPPRDLGRGASPSHACRLHRTLSPGAESSGPAGPADYAGTDRTTAWRHPLSAAAWRAPAVLLSSRLMARPNFRIVRAEPATHVSVEDPVFFDEVGHGLPLPLVEPVDQRCEEP